MGNSDVEEVAIFTRNKYRSLMDHLGTGENWELDQPQMVVCLFFRRIGMIRLIFQRVICNFFHNNRDYFHRGKSSYVLVSGSQFISNTDYQDAFKSHLDQKADVTLISTHVEELNTEHDSCFPY